MTVARDLAAGGPMIAEIDPQVAAAVKVVSLDVDGVMTDGTFWAPPDSAPQANWRSDGSRFHARDGLGIKLMQRAGLKVVLVSGRRSGSARQRAKQLGIDAVSLGDERGKAVALAEILRNWELDFGDAAHLGDDLIDMPLLGRVGLPAAVADSAPRVLEMAAWVSASPGGRGAVREFAEALLSARGELDQIVEEYRG